MFQAMGAFFKNYFNFSGRTRRRDYWLAMLGYTIIMMVLYFILMFSMVSAVSTGETGPLMIISLILMSLFSLAIIIPSIAIVIRRLHDIGKSGCWYLIAFIPVIGAIVIFIFMLMDSQPGDNQWGPNPKGM